MASQEYKSIHSGAEIDAAITAVPNKVDKILGKGLSEADFTTAEKAKLSNLTPSTTDQVNTGTDNTSYITPLRLKERLDVGFGTAAERDVGTGVNDLPDNTQLNARLGTTGNFTGLNTVNGLAKGDGTGGYSSAVANADYLPVNSPAMTGIPTVPTASLGTDTSQAASTAFVQNAFDSLASTDSDVLVGGVEAGSVAKKYRETVNVTEFSSLVVGGDWTAAFNAAIATGKKVFVPAGEYVVSNINVINGLDIEGEKINNSNTVLVVGTSNSGAFTHSTNEIVFDIRIANFTIKAGPNVLNAKAYKQLFKDQYTAYAIFEGINSWLDLEIAFDGFFIFTRWFKCRDGYSGTKRAEHGHHFINSTPANFGTFNTTNLCQVVSCRIFLSEGHRGAVDIAYGSTWVFRDCNFEKLKTRPVYAAGIFQLHITDSWIEECQTTSLIQLNASPNPNAQGVISFEIDNVYFKGIAGNTYLVAGDWSENTSFRHIVCVTVPQGMRLTTAPRVVDIKSVNVLSGSETNVSFINGAEPIYYREIPPPVNVLPIGPSSLGASNFTRVNMTTGVDVSSAIKGQAIRFTVIADNNIAYYTLPSKMLDILKGKSVTVCAAGYGEAGNSPEGVFVSIWSSVTPSASNALSSSMFADASSGTLSSSSASAFIPSDATSIHVGIYCGGANHLKNIYLETLALFLGTSKPFFTGL